MSDMDFDLDDDDTTPDTPGETSTIKAIRKAQREAVARAKAAEAQVAELTAFKAETEAATRRAQVGAIAVQLGLPAGQAALVPSDVEATPEAVREWAVSHDLLRPAADPTSAPTQSFVPVTGAGGVAPDLNISYDAWVAVAQANPAEGRRLVESGRVTPPAGLRFQNIDGQIQLVADPSWLSGA